MSTNMGSEKANMTIKNTHILLLEFPPLQLAGTSVVSFLDLIVVTSNLSHDLFLYACYFIPSSLNS